MRTTKFYEKRTTTLLLLLTGCYLLFLVYSIVSDDPTVELATSTFALLVLGLLAGKLVLEGVHKKRRWPEVGAYGVGVVAMGYSELSNLSLVPSFQHAITIGATAALVGGILVFVRTRILSTPS